MTHDWVLRTADGTAAFVTMTETDLADGDLADEARAALADIEGVAEVRER